MDSNARESLDSKAEFRKPSNDAANRKYRRRSPIGESPSSSDGSPHRGRSSSPIPLRKDVARVSDDKRKRDDGRNQSGRSGDYKHSDRQSSRSHHRHDDHGRRGRRVDDYDRGYSKSSYRSAFDSQDNNNWDHSRSDKEHHSRDYVNGSDGYSRAKSDGSGHRGRDKDSYDRAGSGRRLATIEDRDRDRDRHRESRGDRYGKTDYRKSFGDHRGDHSPAYEESSGQHNDSSARMDTSGHRVTEASWKESKDLESERRANDEKRRDDDRGTFKEQGNREPKEHSDSSIKGQDFVAKKPRMFTLDNTSPGTDGTSEQAYVTDSDIDAAKIAAMKAAELVNKNLVGTGYMSTDQKKKLLWGDKKKTAAEEPAHRWDTPMFGDRERQEKFNKLMSLRLHWWPIVGREGGDKGRAQARQPRCGEAARAASDGIGEAIYSWTTSERWSYRWTRSLKYSFRCLACFYVFLGNMVYCTKKLFCMTMNVEHVVTSRSRSTTGEVAMYLKHLLLGLRDIWFFRSELVYTIISSNAFGLTVFLGKHCPLLVCYSTFVHVFACLGL